MDAVFKSGTTGEVSTRRIFRQKCDFFMVLMRIFVKKRVFYTFYAKSWAPWGLGPLTGNLGPLGALGPWALNAKSWAPWAPWALGP